MVLRKFLFDAIVTFFEAFHLKTEDIQKLQVNVKFNGITRKITGSRINVTEFQPSSTTEFTVEPIQLRKTVEACGMSVIVMYMNNILGTGHISFPQYFIDSIDDDTVDIMHTDSCSFQRFGNIEGNLKVQCRLRTKCESLNDFENGDCRHPEDKSISPHDIMFLIGESQKYHIPCDPCSDELKSEKGDERLKLDLQRYKNINTAGLSTAESFKNNPFGNAICNELKRLSLDCRHAIETNFNKSGRSSSPKLKAQRTVESKTSSSDFTYKKENTMKCRVDLPLIKNIRYCPICLYNLSWLPRFGACPKCGVKPEPVRKKKEEQKLSVEEILKEYLIKPKSNKADSIDKKKELNNNMGQRTVSRCTCKFGKLCANCRIRKMCADFLQPVEQLESVKECQLDNKLSNVSLTNCESQDSRPFLARVYSQLRDTYNIKHSSPLMELDKHCLKYTIPKEKHQIHKEPPKNDLQKSIFKEHKKLTQQIPDRTFSKVIQKKRRIGHKFCAKQLRSVSRHHGWAWSSSREARKYGWRPGAVSKPIKKLMDFFLKNPSKKNNIKDSRICQHQYNKGIEYKNKENQLPVLNVCKKNGEVFITLRDLNNSRAKMKPIVFKIGKSDFAVALREIKRKLKDMGFRKCTCHKSIMMCICRNNMEKQHLESALSNECKLRGMENCVDQLVLSDSSDSEVDFDIEITPPAALAQPTTKRNTINHSTQTSEMNQKLPAEYPKRLSPYWRAYDCAAGDRYTGTAFGMPGEAVFEDGVFGYKGGGPHGPSAAPGGKPKSKGIWGASPGGPMRGGGGINPGGKLGGMSFPGARDKSGAGGAGKQIPVRLTKRYKKAIQDAKAKQEALERGPANKKFNTNVMKYFKTGLTKYDQIGPDGLTDAQRRRKNLFYSPLPPLDTIPRLGMVYNSHATCYNTCVNNYCSPSGGYC